MRRTHLLRQFVNAGKLGEARPPFFALFTQLTYRDKLAVARQMGSHNFDPSLVLGAAARCRFGGVQVLVCAPISSANAKIFPTTFWLVCPWLSRRAGTVEANSGVRRLESFLQEHSLIHQWREYNILHQIIRVELMRHVVGETRLNFMRRFQPGLFESIRRGGVGGTRVHIHDTTPRVKCLHLHTASFLALKYHPAAEWLIQEKLALGEDCDCNGRLCDLCRG